MALNTAALFWSRPPSFLHLLRDTLLLLGLPYGPQARATIASLYPELFGRSSATLRGYERWLARTCTPDSMEAFSTFMHERYRRWTTPPEPARGTPSAITAPLPGRR